MNRKLWTLLLALGAALALCVGAGAADFSTGWDEVTNSTTTLGSGRQYYLNSDVTVSQTITVSGTVTLDLNGHVLQYKNDSTKGSVIKVEGGGQLTIQDSCKDDTTAVHKFDTTNDLWVLNDNPPEGKAETIQGGVITGGTGTQWDQYYRGGGVYVAPGGALTMNGGSIVGCSANGSSFSLGGGVYLDSSANSNADTFTMNGGSIIGCTADGGGGVLVALECHFTMNTGAVIRSCTAQMGGGVYYLGMSGSSGMFTLNGGTIQSCKALGGGGGGVCNSGKFLMQNGLIETCASVKDSNASGGVLNSGQFTMSGGTVEDNVTNSGTINADGGKITGEVTNGVDKGPGKITGTSDDSDKTEFTNTVTNHSNSTLSGFGTFTGRVTNNGGKITGFCTFTGTVINNGGKIIGFCDFKEATLIGYLIVTFDPDNGEQSLTRQVPWCKDGAALTEPSPAPTKDGYSFDGWYRGYGWDKWDFDTNKVSYTMTLTAKWTENPPAPSYDDSDPTYAVSAPTAENGKVTVSPRYAERGERVTVTLTPDEGFELESLTVTDSRGNELTLTDKDDGRYTFTMPARRVEVKASFVKSVEVSPFADVAIDAYYYEAVKWAAENGITGGVGNSLFAPNQPCTRGQIVTFLWRAAGSPVVNYAMNMTDVAEDAYYAEAVRWALSEGITTGTGDGKFSPDVTCTRAQAVTFLARALNANASGKAEFGDVPTDSYFAEAVAWAAANGVTEGVGGGLFGSDNSCTRGQIVTFLYRAYNK